MNTMISWLENSFAPKMNKVNHNVWVVTIKDSIMQVLPFIFLGSLFSMLAILNDFFPSLPSFWTPFGWTMGMISLFVAYLIPFNLMEKKRLRKLRIVAGLTGIIVFLIIVSPQVIIDGAIGFSHESLGAGGMFVAIIAGAFTGWLMSLFGKFSFFKEESVIPDFVKQWFDFMLPIGVALVISWTLVDILSVDIYNIVLSIFRPLGGIVESPFGFALVMFIFTFIYSMGISSWVLTPIFTPIFLQAITENIQGTAENLATSTTIYSTYLWVGGIGATFPLVIMLMRSKSKKLKALGTASFVPSIFNINEPVVFGSIAWNPLLMLPMWLQGLVLPLITWFFTKTINFAPVPTIQVEMWYLPYPIGTWLATYSVSALLLLAINIVVSTLIWYPFFKAYEKQEVRLETEEQS